MGAAARLTKIWKRRNELIGKTLEEVMAWLEENDEKFKMDYILEEYYFGRAHLTIGRYNAKPLEFIFDDYKVKNVIKKDF